MNAVRKILQKLGMFEIVILFTFVIAAAVAFYYFSRSSQYLTVTVKAGYDTMIWDYKGTKPWFGSLFTVGMAEKDGFGVTNAEVLSLRSYDSMPDTRYNSFPGNSMYGNKAVYLTLKLKTVYNRASDQHTYKGRPVSIGSIIRLNLNNILFDGLVSDINGFADTREKKIITVDTQVRDETPVFPETAGIKSYIADAITEGEKITDDQGNVLVEIVKKRVEPAKKIITTSSGGLVVGADPFRKDVYLTLKVHAIKIQNRYFVFDDVPLLIGMTVPIHTGSYSLWPEITKFVSAE